MKWSLAVRWWHGLMSVVTAAGVGVVTNLATTEFSWALTAALVALVLMQATLSVLQGVQDHRGRRVARDSLLGPLRPAVPDPPDSSPMTDAESGAVTVAASHTAASGGVVFTGDVTGGSGSGSTTGVHIGRVGDDPPDPSAPTRL